MHSFNDWLKIEQVTRKAIQGAKQFAGPEAERHLEALETAVAEIRHAAGQLAESVDRLGHEPKNPRTPAVVKADDEVALERLSAALFKRPGDHSPQPPNIHA